MRPLCHLVACRSSRGSDQEDDQQEDMETGSPAVKSGLHNTSGTSKPDRGPKDGDDDDDQSDMIVDEGAEHGSTKKRKAMLYESDDE